MGPTTRWLNTASLANVNAGSVRDRLACPAVFRITTTTAALASYTANSNARLDTIVISTGKNRDIEDRHVVRVDAN